MKNRIVVGNVLLLATLALSALIWAGCTPAAAAQDNQGHNKPSGQNGADDSTRAPEDTPEAGSTPLAMHSGKITAVVEAINGSTITINGVDVTVKNAQDLAGISVGDSVTVEIETEDDGSLVVTSISQDGEDDDATLEATDDNGNDSLETPEATDDNGQDATLEATDDNGEDATQEAEQGDDNGADTGDDDNGGSGGNGSSGGNGGGSDDGGHGEYLPLYAGLA